MDKDRNSFSENDFTPSSFHELEKTIENINSNSTLKANENISKGRNTSKIRVFTNTFIVFWKFFLAKGFFKKGVKGFIYSVSHASAAMLTDLKQLKLQNKF